ncbi:LysR family transcriptional regulator [Tersicoccus sp. Bi-70]|uniref:LysR family transcriptional regulator n=1 Tax=Tersicoccus sp. Bi-70 TaxID=1897634 RepID=UPI0009770738|nr:LysR family transcriptional regulator [Tersicoccus sp. Bi-70]OMH36924.1 transcriptional regulator [Tersicoccus sp. Bi-70]
MDVRHLQLLRELADRGSITAVAAATYRTVSAVSQQLRTAQRDAGMRLVEPDGRGVRLTEAGRVLAAGGVEVETVLAAVQARWDDYRNHPGGAVSVAAFPSAATLLFPSVLQTTARAGIELRIVDVDLAEHEFAGLTVDHDIVIAHHLGGSEPPGASGLVVRELAVEPLDIAMASTHPLAGQEVLTADDVADASWIGVPEGYPLDTVLTAIAAQLGRPLHVAQRIRDNRLVEALVAGSDHLAVLPRFTTSNSGLTLTPIVEVAARRHLSALMRPDRAQRRAVRTTLEAIADAARTASY